MSVTFISDYMVWVFVEVEDRIVQLPKLTFILLHLNFYELLLIDNHTTSFCFKTFQLFSFVGEIY